MKARDLPGKTLVQLVYFIKSDPLEYSRCPFINLFGQADSVELCVFEVLREYRRRNRKTTTQDRWDTRRIARSMVEPVAPSTRRTRL